MNGFPDKKELRKQMLARRQELSGREAEERSRTICGRLLEQEAFRESRNICLYMPVRNEVDVTFLFNEAWERGKDVWLPRVDGEGRMRFFAYGPGTPLITGKYGIREPDVTRVLEAGEHTLIVMPGAVFSKKRNRIGYGGGFYDRYLEENPACRTIAVCYDFQIVEDFPAERHDKKPEIIISEDQIIWEE